MSGMAHFFVVVSGSKIHERVAHFFIDIYSPLSRDDALLCMFSCLSPQCLKCQNKGRLSIKSEEPRSMPLRVSAEALFYMKSSNFRE